MSNPINSQIQNLRLRIEILQDRMEIESKTCYELSLKEALTSASKFEYERLSCMTVTQIGKRIDAWKMSCISYCCSLVHWMNVHCTKCKSTLLSL
ncbi:hypothetical protein LCGC14_0887340 [marine sediment metagenome]|uniref:Uncharacterized protein n=1 Tax=marine sediment metagenome TaxID=412755 RepID=A0A0F9S758_9ZZZZ